MPRARTGAPRAAGAARDRRLPAGSRAHRRHGGRRRGRVGARGPRDRSSRPEVLIEPGERRRREAPGLVRGDRRRRHGATGRGLAHPPLPLPTRSRAALLRSGLQRREPSRRLRRRSRRRLLAEAARRREAQGARHREGAPPHVSADLLLRGGTVIDGTGSPERRADVLVRNGRIAAVARDLAPDGARVIDAGDRVVAPGFIDIHSHSDEAMFVNDALESALHMGVTLVVCGNCGGSSAPVSGLAEAELDRELSRLAVTRTWSSFAEYADAVDRAKPAINVCSFVGHGTLRSCVMGAVARAPTESELDNMRDLLRRSMDEGAIGLASGLIYPPSAFGD